MTFGVIILFENWRSLIGMMLSGYLPLQEAMASDTLLGAVARVATELLPAIPAAIGDLTAIIGIVVGLAIGIVLIVGNVVIVKWARKRYGPFVGE